LSTPGQQKLPQALQNGVSRSV